MDQIPYIKTFSLALLLHSQDPYEGRCLASRSPLCQSIWAMTPRCERRLSANLRRRALGAALMDKAEIIRLNVERYRCMLRADLNKPACQTTQRLLGTLNANYPRRRRLELAAI